MSAGASAVAGSPTPPGVSNTEALVNILYTDYFYLFQAAGMVLLIAMIGAIVLTHREREGVKRQRIAAQRHRRCFGLCGGIAARRACDRQVIDERRRVGAADRGFVFERSERSGAARFRCSRRTFA